MTTTDKLDFADKTFQSAVVMTRGYSEILSSRPFGAVEEDHQLEAKQGAAHARFAEVRSLIAGLEATGMEVDPILIDTCTQHAVEAYAAVRERIGLRPDPVWSPSEGRFVQPFVASVEDRELASNNAMTVSEIVRGYMVEAAVLSSTDRDLFDLLKDLPVCGRDNNPSFAEHLLKVMMAVDSHPLEGSSAPTYDPNDLS